MELENLSINIAATQQGNLALLHEWLKVHTAQEWKRIIGKGISFLEELLPLGSVVELQKEFLEEKMPSLKDAGKAVLVITERYLSLTGHSYFPYAGVPYPTGTFDGTSRMLFSPALIKEVLHTGYQEEQEQAYQYRMKREYLLEKDMDFANASARNEMEDIIRRMMAECDRLISDIRMKKI